MRGFVIQKVEDGSYPFDKHIVPLDAALLFGAQPVPVFKDGEAPTLDDLHVGRAGRFKLLVDKETVYTVTCVDTGRFAFFASPANYTEIDGKLKYHHAIAFENEPGFVVDRYSFHDTLEACEAYCLDGNAKGGLTPEWAQAIVASSLRASEDRKKLHQPTDNEVLLQVSVVFPNGIPDQADDMIIEATESGIRAIWDRVEVNID